MESIKYCQLNKGLEVYAWVIMTNDVHLIIGTNKNDMSDIIRDLKKYTSVKIIEAIESNKSESRREWILQLLETAGQNNSNNKHYQFWIQDNHPIELSTNEMQEDRVLRKFPEKIFNEGPACSVSSIYI